MSVEYEVEKAIFVKLRDVRFQVVVHNQFEISFRGSTMKFSLMKSQGRWVLDPDKEMDGRLDGRSQIALDLLNSKRGEPWLTHPEVLFKPGDVIKISRPIAMTVSVAWVRVGTGGDVELGVVDGAGTHRIVYPMECRFSFVDKQ